VGVFVFFTMICCGVLGAVGGGGGGGLVPVVKIHGVRWFGQ
jgi:hypothetical protein